MRWMLLSLSVLVSTPALARPGFYVGLGFDPVFVSGESVDVSRLSPVAISGTGVPPLTTNIGNGLGAGFRLGFNILGYGAIEAIATAHSNNLFDGNTREWEGHVHIGGRVYPVWHWQYKLPEYLQPLEPSLFIGWGGSGSGYVPYCNTAQTIRCQDPVGWHQTGTWRYGVGLEYFVMTYFKVTLDYSYVRANYATFDYNFRNKDQYTVSPPAATGYHNIIIGGAFQFGPPQEAVRYDAPPTATPAPAAPIETPLPAPVDG